MIAIFQNNDQLQIISKSIVQREANPHNYSVDVTKNSQVNGLSLDYDNIYSSNVAVISDKKPKHKYSIQPHHVIPKNISEVKIKQRRTPIPDAKNENQNYSNENEEKYYQDANEKNSSMAESRNSSLVIISTNDQGKSLSKSRPKQRQPKLIDDSEKVSSILKMLEKNHKVEFLNGNSSKDSIPKILSNSTEVDPKTDRTKRNTLKITVFNNTL